MPMLDWHIVADPGLRDTVVRGVRARAGRVQLLLGESGIGKTTLASAVARQLEDSGYSVLPIVGLAELKSVPLAAMTPLLARARSEADHASASERLQALFAFVASGGARRVLMVDDGPLLDEVSAAAVYQLVRVYGIPCVMTARTIRQLTAPLPKLFDEQLVDVFDIVGLDRESAQEVVRRTLGGPVEPDSLRALVGLADGNPLFLRELVVAAVARGVEVGQRGFVVDSAGLPPRLRDSIAERFEGLSVEQRQLCDLLAVAEPWPPQLLDEPALVASLEALGLATRSSDGNIHLFHPAFGEALRDLMPAQVADTLKIEAAGRLSTADREDERFRAFCLLAETSSPPTVDELAWAANYADSLDDHVMSVRLADLALSRGANFLASLVRARSLSSVGSLDAADAAFDDAERLALTDEELLRMANGRGYHLAIRRQRPKDAIRMALAVLETLEDSPAQDYLKADIAKWRIIAGDTGPAPGREGTEFVDTATEFNDLTLRLIAAVFASDLDTVDAVVTRARVLVDETRIAVPHGADMVSFAEFMARALRGSFDDAIAEVDLPALDGTAAYGLWNWGIGWFTLHAGRATEALHFATVAYEQLSWRDFVGALGTATALRATAATLLGQRQLARGILDDLGVEVREQAAVLLQAAEAEAWMCAEDGDSAGAVAIVRDAVRRGIDARYFGPAAFTAYVAVRLGRPQEVMNLLTEIGAVAQGAVIGAIIEHARALLARDAESLLRAARTLVLVGLRSGAVDAARQAADLASGRGRNELARQASMLATKWEAGLSGFQPTAQAVRAFDLTEREWIVAQAAAGRERSKEIAARLGVSARTVDNQLASIYRKLAVSNRDELRAELQSLNQSEG
ncbi:MAG: hypothetical protein JWQ39_2571 [Glaciihabitans sp.]|nr:hypothetical protein [Glaciihabitans sp.]